MEFNINLKTPLSALTSTKQLKKLDTQLVITLDQQLLQSLAETLEVEVLWFPGKEYSGKTYPKIANETLLAIAKELNDL